MVFSSAIFLFFFLPSVILIHLLGGVRLRNLVLLIASLFFYAWGETIYVSLMILSVTFNHIFAVLIGSTVEQGSQAKIRPKILLIIAVVFNLGLLGFFKYANFFIDNLSFISGLLTQSQISIPPIHLPIGISFFLHSRHYLTSSTSIE